MPIQVADIEKFKNELLSQLKFILAYWSKYSPDPRDGGFWGEITDDNEPNPKAEKGSVLNARILWSFSRAYKLTNDPTHLKLAQRAYNYFRNHFEDLQYGGVYWAVPSSYGNNNAGLEAFVMKGGRKQIYAQAFWIYALSEYYFISRDQVALQSAKDLFKLIEVYSYDRENGGYIEAFTRNWTQIEDLRLSKKDANEVKTMNTHLHILEAYMSLYQRWPDSELKRQIGGLLNCFDQFIINSETGHLQLFFDRNWKVKGGGQSYGHDIEASWLLLEAASIIEDEEYIIKMKAHCLLLAKSASLGLDLESGGLNYESIPSEGAEFKLVKQKHWWVQAEALVGFLEAFLQSGEEQYFLQAIQVWRYIQQHIISKTGEWIWGIDCEGQPMKGYYKVGLWKCPYHNVRSMIESAHRLHKIIIQQQN